MTYTIGEILCAHLLDKNQEHCPIYIAVYEMAINSTINASIKKAQFEVLHIEIILLPVDLLFSRESTINLHAYTFASKMKQLVIMVKNAIYNA